MFYDEYDESEYSPEFMSHTKRPSVYKQREWCHQEFNNWFWHFDITILTGTLHEPESNSVFRSASASCRTFDVPSTRPVHPSRNNFSWVHRWAVTLPPGLRYPSNCIFYESWWCQLSNSDENTNTKTNTDTNTNTETNKGKTNDSYDVIYCLKGDDKRILNMICYRQRL